MLARFVNCNPRASKELSHAAPVVAVILAAGLRQACWTPHKLARSRSNRQAIRLYWCTPSFVLVCLEFYMASHGYAVRGG